MESNKNAELSANLWKSQPAIQKPSTMMGFTIFKPPTSAVFKKTNVPKLGEYKHLL
jgi:hypothetical protein